MFLARSLLRVRSTTQLFCSVRTNASVGTIYNPTDVHEQLRNNVRLFTEKEVDPQANEYNAAEKFNHSLFRKLGDLGLLGITADDQFGGSGLDATAVVIAHEELSCADPAFTLSYLAHTLLFVNNLNFNGSEAQKKKYLPQSCTGEKIGGMAMSESAAGTDVLGMKTTAKKTKDGYLLNGQKMWITNGAISDTELGDYFLVYAKTGPRTKDVSLFIVEKGYQGFKLGQRIKGKLGMRASPTAELVFDDCLVPPENLIGHENSAVEHMMRNLEIERVGLAAMALGIARRSLEVMADYSLQRKSFAQPLLAFGQIQRMVALSYAEYQAARAYVYDTASAINLDKSGNRLASDGVKLFATNMAKEVSDRAIQVLGGNGYTAEYKVERLWRDSKLLEIGGGTNEAHQKNIAKDIMHSSDPKTLFR